MFALAYLVVVLGSSALILAVFVLMVSQSMRRQAARLMVSPATIVSKQIGAHLRGDWAHLVLQLPDKSQYTVLAPRALHHDLQRGNIGQAQWIDGRLIAFRPALRPGPQDAHQADQ